MAGGALTPSAKERRDHGWDAAVTLVTPIDRSRPIRWRRRFVLTALNHGWLLELGQGLGLPHLPPLEDNFKLFNHLHVARWSLVDDLPRTSPDQPKETGRYTLLLFTSHFDFGWRRYLGTFIESIGDGLNLLWADAPSWVSPQDGFSQFEQFVDDQRVDHAHLFAAYPNWSCNDVRSALRRQHETQSADIDETVLRETLGVAGGREARARGLQRRLQYCLGEVIPIEKHYREIAAAERPATPYPTRGVTYLLPVRRASVDEVRGAIEALPFGPHSPFAAIPGTHFARMAIIDDRYFARQQARVDPLRSAYLLLSAEIDGDAEPWLAALLRDPRIREVLGGCWGFAYQSDPVGFVQRCRIRGSVEYRDYPMTTVNDIFAASAAL